MSTTQHAAFIGASRGIGRYTLLYLLQGPGEWTATSLLRKPSTYDDDADLKPFIENGRLTIVKGDGTVEADIAKLFDRKVDLIMSSVGGTPKLTWRGMGLNQPDICTAAALALVNVLKTLPETEQPRVIGVSSMGIGDNHQYMPLAMRIMYPWLIHLPHQDKLGAEYVLFNAARSIPVPTSPIHIPPTDLLPVAKREAAPKDFLKEVIVIRPALLTGDEPALGKEATKASETLYTYSVRRSDVGRFVAEECVPGKDEWVNKAPVIGY